MSADADRRIAAELTQLAQDLQHDRLCPAPWNEITADHSCFHCDLIAKVRADTAARISDAISDAFGRDERALDCADLAAQMFPVQAQP